MWQRRRAELAAALAACGEPGADIARNEGYEQTALAQQKECDGLLADTRQLAEAARHAGRPPADLPRQTGRAGPGRGPPPTTHSAA